MENLHKLVFEATLEPEKFKFYKLTNGPDDYLRYLFIHAPNDNMTNKVFYVFDKGLVKYKNITSTASVYFENWERIIKETEESGFEQIYLKIFAAELHAISQLFDQEIE
jgi:hypothetical protein